MKKSNKSLFNRYWLFLPLMAIMCPSFGSGQPLSITVNANFTNNSMGYVCINPTGAWSQDCNKGYQSGSANLTQQYNVGDYPSYQLITWGATGEGAGVNATLDSSCSGPPLNGTLSYATGGLPVLTVTVPQETIAKFNYMYQLNVVFDGLTFTFSCSQKPG